MAKPIEVVQPDGGTSYHVTVDKAWEMVKASNAKWLSRRQIELMPFVNARKPVGYSDAWALIPSDGMPVWQMR